MKCLPANKLPLAHGNILHDWHAEVVAIRAFNRFLLDECLLISTPPYPTSQWVRHRSKEEQAPLEPQPYTIRENVKIHMYCSEAPCGDASMELVMAAQEDSTPWTSAPPIVTSPSSEGLDSNEDSEVSALRGRSNFSHLGLVRLKPSRPDAPPTRSKSCTDKLALKQGTSLLSSVTSSLLSPRNAYIATLVLPHSQFVPEACDRAFSRSGRLNAVSDKNWKAGYRWSPFDVKPTIREFSWSRRSVGPGEKAVACNLSAVWTPNWQETLIGGVLQGRKQLDPRGASRVCRRGVWGAAARVALLAGVTVLEKRRYEDIKCDDSFDERRKVKEDLIRTGLKGWVENVGDADFELGNGVS